MSAHATPPRPAPGDRTADPEGPLSCVDDRGTNGMPLMGGSLFDEHPIAAAVAEAAPALRRDPAATTADPRRAATLIIRMSWLERLRRWFAPRR